MSTIVTEGKKISELPINLGFSNNAVVLISDGGVTTRMLLSSLINRIKSELSGTDNAIMKKVDALLLRMSSVEKKNLSQDEAYDLLERNTAKTADVQNVNIAACKAVVDQIRYQRHVVKNTDSMRDTSMTLPTSNLAVGDVVDYEYLVGADINCDVYVRRVLPGTKMEYADASVFRFTDNTQNILVCTSPTIGGTVLEVLPVSEMVETHSHTFTSEGYVFINLNRMSGENEILYFYDENNFSNMQTLPEVNTAMNTFVLSVVNGAWAAVPPDASGEIEKGTVKFTEQTLTEEQKKQVRINIGGASAEELGRVRQTIADYTVPDYVVTGSEEIANKVLAVRNVYSFVFGAVSDMHTTGSDESAVGVAHAGMAVDAINDRAQLDLVANFGDICVGRFTDTYKNGFLHAKKSFSDVAKAVPYIHMQGNHDELSTDTTAEAQQKYYAYIGANNVETVTDWDNRFRNYGYKDFEDQKMRVIYLNSADVSAAEITDDCYVTAEQLTWLVNTALNFTDKTDAEEWSFVVFSHHPLNWFGNVTNVLTILDAYKGKTSGSVTVDSTTVSYNFTGASGEFIAHFHGHLHNFRAETLGTNAVLTVTIPNACFDRNNEYGTYAGYSDEVHEKYGDIDSAGNQRQYNKTADTAEDTAFNVVVIDRQSRKIHCFNYGAGIDREITFDGEVVESDEPIKPIEPEIGYTNLVPTSIGTDKEIYNGTGYKEGYRLSGSSGNESAATGAVVSGFIPVKAGDVIRVYGSTYTSNNASGNYVCGYDSNFGYITNNYVAPTDAAGNKGMWDTTGEKVLWAVDTSLLPTMPSYIRVSMYGCTGEDFIVTINEEITD